MHKIASIQGGGEQFLKGWVVTSVNEWGGDQERLMLLTDRRMYRVKFDFDTKSASSIKAIELSDVLRIEYGSFKAAKTSLTTWVWKKEIEQQQVHCFLPTPCVCFASRERRMCI